MKKFMTILSLATILTMAACVSDHTTPEIINRVKVGDTAPLFTVSGPEGMFASPAGFLGKTSVLALFNTGCPDCAREMPKIYALWQNIQNDPSSQIVPIAREQTAEDVAEDWRYGEMVYYVDPDRSVFEKFANSTIPRIYIVGPDGAILWMAVEYLLNEDGSEMNAAQFEEIFREYSNTARTTFKVVN